MLWVSCNLLFRVYFRYSVRNAPRLRGPYVVVANHTSFLDPLFLSAAQRRRVCYLMSEVFYRSPRAYWFYRFARAIPVSPRGGNRQAMRAARDALARGDVIGIFPEGGLSRDGELYLGQPGAVSLVLSSGVPVVPAGMTGAYDAMPPSGGWPRPARVRVRFGPPLTADELSGPKSPDRKARLGAATRRIMREIGALTEQRSREQVLGRD